jgi:SMODS-associating 2TM, beta-strand rich effector domain
VFGTATITQTYSSISIRLKTESSSSFLIAERLIRHGDGACEVIGGYQSDPSIHLRGKQSEIHYGYFRYSVTGNPPTEMSGHYWTDRNTTGSIRLTLKA